jgi:hypothetical protein
MTMEPVESGNVIIHHSSKIHERLEVIMTGGPSVSGEGVSGGPLNKRSGKIKRRRYHS